MYTVYDMHKKEVIFLALTLMELSFSAMRESATE